MFCTIWARLKFGIQTWHHSLPFDMLCYWYIRFVHRKFVQRSDTYTYVHVTWHRHLYVSRNANVYESGLSLRRLQIMGIKTSPAPPQRKGVLARFSHILLLFEDDGWREYICMSVCDHWSIPFERTSTKRLMYKREQVKTSIIRDMW
jgi:hypothetical protein